MTCIAILTFCLMGYVKKYFYCIVLEQCCHSLDESVEVSSGIVLVLFFSMEGSKPGCLRACLLRWSLLMNLLSHNGHRNFFSPENRRKLLVNIQTGVSKSYNPTTLTLFKEWGIT